MIKNTNIKIVDVKDLSFEDEEAKMNNILEEMSKKNLDVTHIEYRKYSNVIEYLVR